MIQRIRNLKILSSEILNKDEKIAAYIVVFYMYLCFRAGSQLYEKRD